MKTASFRNDVLPLKNMLYRLALRITLNQEEAEDVVQDTLLKVWNQRDNWHNIDSMEAYCTTVCRNLALDHVKKNSHRQELFDNNLPLDRADSAFSPYEEMIHKDRIRLVRDVINALPEKQRTCIQLRDFEGKTYKEIADILQVSEEQVKVSIFRGRQTIKKKFEHLNEHGL